MRFTVDGVTYAIEFSRSFRTVHLPYRVKGLKKSKTAVKVVQKSFYPYTTVNILPVDLNTGKPVVDPEGQPVIHRTWTVGCSHRDNFSPEEGRMNALRGVTRGNSLSREFKRAVWNAYWSRSSEFKKRVHE